MRLAPLTPPFSLARARLFPPSSSSEEVSRPTKNPAVHQKKDGLYVSNCYVQASSDAQKAVRCCWSRHSFSHPIDECLPTSFLSPSYRSTAMLYMYFMYICTLCSRNSDPGSHSRPFSSFLTTVRALHFYREKIYNTDITYHLL